MDINREWDRIFPPEVEDLSWPFAEDLPYDNFCEDPYGDTSGLIEED